MRFICLILALFICSVGFAAPMTLALNWKAEPEFGGFYEALLQGFYKKYGLDIKIQEGGSGTPTVQMLANDKVDFAIVGADEIILSQAKNKNKVKAIFAAYHTAPYIIMTHSEKNFKSLKEVFTSEGIISIQSGLPYYQYLVKKIGKENIKAKIVPYSGGVTQFLNDKNLSQQGFITSEPLIAEQAGARVKNFLVADEGFNPYVVVVATTENLIKKQSTVVENFVKATREGWEAYLKAPQKTNDYMASLNKSMNLETFNKSAEAQKSLIERKREKLGTMNTARWEKLVQQLKDLGLLKEPIKAENLFVDL